MLWLDPGARRVFAKPRRRAHRHEEVNVREEVNASATTVIFDLSYAHKCNTASWIRLAPIVLIVHAQLDI